MPRPVNRGSNRRCGGAESAAAPCGFGGGYIVSPANALTPDISFGNLEALFEVARDG